MSLDKDIEEIEKIIRDLNQKTHEHLEAAMELKTAQIKEERLYEERAAFHKKLYAKIDVITKNTTGH